MVSARACMTGKKLCLNIDKIMNKLESFSRRNNKLFFPRTSTKDLRRRTQLVSQRWFNSWTAFIRADVRRRWLHRRQGKLSYCSRETQERSWHYTPNIRVASDRTVQQSFVLREETSEMDGFTTTQELCESRGGRPGLPSLISQRFLRT